MFTDTIWQKQYVATANENGSYVRWEKASDEFINVNENDLNFHCVAADLI